eukprot:TRINITY_DN11224_c0_g1_i1.p1 TRINITY_DN11224_c0_g1~~TRINITY_DN11224_c0_g1_i1.p1  ORF type:complete len:234 (+),score=61.55 TRINITY_DN11224_c0_g1_i1:43-744(+)
MVVDISKMEEGMDRNIKKEKKKKKKRELDREQEIENLVEKTQQHLDSNRKIKKRKDPDPEESSPEKKAKFSIKLNTENKASEKDEDTSDGIKSKLEPLNKGKGPKIIVAKEDKKEEDESTMSKRKLKAIKRQQEGRIHETKGMNKALEYLHNWKNARDTWKFEKCRQNWLLSHAYDQNKIKESDFCVLLEYITSIRGGMREATRSSALKESGKEVGKSEKSRASRILQALEQE